MQLTNIGISGNFVKNTPILIGYQWDVQIGREHL